MTVKHTLKDYPVDTLEPGDSLLANDPWMGTGHLPDLTIVTPIFHDGRLVAFVGSIAHSPDTGGMGLSGESREVYRVRPSPGAQIVLNEATAIREYVVNILPYVDRGVPLKIQGRVETQRRTAVKQDDHRDRGYPAHVIQGCSNH
jgi:hypothetical protein